MSKADRFDACVVACLALGAGLIGAALRQWASYPLDPSDERNWIAIAAQVAQGVDWPISGPLHFAASQALASALNISHAQALAVLGVLAAPGVVLAYAASYRLMGFYRSWPTLVLLCASSYFWAPLLESRPQQWGQALVVLCTALAWRGFKQSPRHAIQPQTTLWLGWCLLFLVCAWVHLLSGAVVLMLCGALGFGIALFHPDRLPSVLRWGAAALPGLLVMVWPDGPYRGTWSDVTHQQLLLRGPGLWALGLTAIAATWALAATLKRLGPEAVRVGLAQMQAHPKRWAGMTVGAALLLLAVQASLLPADAWIFYQGSLLLFATQQLGNLFFLWLVVIGLLHVAAAPALRAEAAWQGQAALLTSVGLLAVAALLGSTTMIYTNWMLRVINYALPLAAPFAAIGFISWPVPMVLKCALLAIAACLSLMAAGQLLPVFLHM